MREHAPDSPPDWQAAVDAAMRVLVLASARRYGIVHTNGVVNEEGAKRILEMGRQRQFVPTPSDSERFLTGVIRKERKRLCRLLMIGLEHEDLSGNDHRNYGDDRSLASKPALFHSSRCR